MSDGDGVRTSFLNSSVNLQDLSEESANVYLSLKSITNCFFSTVMHNKIFRKPFVLGHRLWVRLTHVN